MSKYKPTTTDRKIKIKTQRSDFTARNTVIIKYKYFASYDCGSYIKKPMKIIIKKPGGGGKNTITMKYKHKYFDPHDCNSYINESIEIRHNKYFNIVTVCSNDPDIFDKTLQNNLITEIRNGFSSIEEHLKEHKGLSNLVNPYYIEKITTDVNISIESALLVLNEINLSTEGLRLVNSNNDSVLYDNYTAADEDKENHKPYDPEQPLIYMDHVNNLQSIEQDTIGSASEIDDNF